MKGGKEAVNLPSLPLSQLRRAEEVNRSAPIGAAGDEHTAIFVQHLTRALSETRDALLAEEIKFCLAFCDFCTRKPVDELRYTCLLWKEKVSHAQTARLEA